LHVCGLAFDDSETRIHQRHMLANAFLANAFLANAFLHAPVYD
jgi:hypothetical protein